MPLIDGPVFDLFPDRKCCSNEDPEPYDDRAGGQLADGQEQLYECQYNQCPSADQDEFCVFSLQRRFLNLAQRVENMKLEISTVKYECSGNQNCGIVPGAARGSRRCEQIERHRYQQ